jgi:hypothetical protein
MAPASLVSSPAFHLLLDGEVPWPEFHLPHLYSGLKNPHQSPRAFSVKAKQCQLGHLRKFKFKASLGCTARPCLNIVNK